MKAVVWAAVLGLSVCMSAQPPHLFFALIDE
jgi:hypothetical protein